MLYVKTSFTMLSCNTNQVKVMDMSFKDMEGVELKRIEGKVAVMMRDNPYAKEGESKYETYLGVYYENFPELNEDAIDVISVFYEVPTDDKCFDRLAIESLKAEKQRVIAASRLEQTRIEGKIQKLMAIEHIS